MSGTPDASVAAARWLDGAAEDLEAARVLLGAGQSPRIACFHAHLAAEKALKALIITVGHRPPRIHNLLELSGQLSERLEARFDAAALALLNPWATRGRYTDEQGDATSEEAERLIECASQAVDVAVGALAEIRDKL